MSINAINGSALSGFSAVDGVNLSTLTAINGQSLGVAVAGDVVFLGSADVEPTAGGTPRWWDGVSGSAPPTGTGATSPHGREWESGGGGQVSWILPASTLVISGGTRWWRSADTTHLIMRFYDGGTGEHVELDYVAGGNFRVNRNVSTQLAISTGGHITLNTHFYFEITAVIDDTAGSFTAKLYNDSGTLLETISASGVDTRDGAGSVSQVLFGPMHAWEDVWVDITGQLYGRSQTELSAPNGAGDLTQLTRGGSDSGANWSQVDEVPVSGTTDYVTSTGADQYDSYTFPNRSVSGTPAAAGVSAACLASAGTVTFNFICRISGVTYEHATVHTATTTQRFFGGYWRNNPATGFAWTDAQINSAQFGIRWRAANGRTNALYRATLVQL